MNNKLPKNKPTFIVKIDNNQNGTYQGRLIWADENQTQHFRSALELIRLMDDAYKKGEMVLPEAKES